MSELRFNPDKAVARLAVIEAEKRSITNERDGARARIDAEATAALEPLMAEENFVRQSLKEHFVVNRKTIFPGKEKSVRLLAGVVGFRLSPPKLTVSKLATFAERVKTVFGKQADKFLTIKVTPDKTMLGKLSDDQLKKLGIKRSQKEEFFIELDQARVDEAYGAAVGAGK